MSATKLEELVREIIKCNKCRLAKTRLRTVPGEGSENAEILFVGEAPGRNEDLAGKPFVGSAGKFLTELINLLALERKDVYITNVVKCRPPKNRKPTEEEIKTCLSYLKRQIAIIKPRIIVLLGNVAIQTLLDKNLISTKAHGTVHKKEGIIYFLTFHPAAALYMQKLKKVMIGDFKKLTGLL
ncbi:MAG: uracil-DNA glycosylase [Candidatus Thermoplasmatota archaeon]|nr:uracil-DNA glycosylase [Candidatus Thermoplasmatota archaeon]